MHRRKLFGAAIFLALTVAGASVRAEEPAGCDKFKWPIQREQAALASPDRQTVKEDGVLASGSAAMVLLAPVETVHFTEAPQRAPAPKTYAAVLKLASPAAGVYTVSLSGAAWIDAIQDGVEIKPLAFSGARECPNIRKSLQYQFEAKEAVIQISNSAESEISLVVLPQ
jgi:hypothetical protein